MTAIHRVLIALAPALPLDREPGDRSFGCGAGRSPRLRYGKRRESCRDHLGRLRPPFWMLLAVAACATTRPQSPPVSSSDAVLALADEYVAQLFARYPEDATIAGYPDADHAAITDNRPEALRAWHAQEDALLARVRRIRGLAPGSRAWLVHTTVLDALESSVQMRACRAELWGVASVPAFFTYNYGGGWQVTYSDVAGVQPIGTVEARRAAVARLAALPRFVDQETANLREGMRLGFTATRGNVERVLGSLDELLALAPSRWPFLSPAERDGDPALRADLERIVADELAPVTRRYRDFLAKEYLPRARSEPGVSSLPNGDACYRAAIRSGTTHPADPHQLREIGLIELNRIRGEMRIIAERSFHSSDVAAVLRRLSTDAQFRYTSEQEIISDAQGAIARAKAELPRAFSRLPRCEPVVRPYAPAIASAGAAASSLGSMSADCYQGTYFVNTWDPGKTPRLGAESTAFHEAWPGHFLEAALKAEAPGPPASWRYLVNNAYSEGWALYSERLADELGLFTTDFERIGMLQLQAFRAARLVADTGLHAFGWSREQAAAFLADAIGGDATSLLSEVDRYCAWPGQALGYMTGALEFRAARADAERAMGARFDLPSFHDLVLDAAVPMPALRERVRIAVAK